MCKHREINTPSTKWRQSASKTFLVCVIFASTGISWCLGGIKTGSGLRWIHDKRLQGVNHHVENHLAWKTSVKAYKKALHKARATYYSGLIEENKNNPRFLFSSVGRLTESHTSTEPSIPRSLNSNIWPLWPSLRIKFKLLKIKSTISCPQFALIPHQELKSQKLLKILSIFRQLLSDHPWSDENNLALNPQLVS